MARAQVKRNPFHPFSSFDTATLGGIAFGQTVLMRATLAAGLEWDTASAHSAAYDADARQICSASCAINFRRIRRQPPAPGGMGPLEVESDPKRRSLSPWALGRDGAGFGEQLLEFAALVHFQRDVAAADQLAVDIQLRESRPL